MRGWFSREYEPIETVDPGGSVSFQVPNAGWFWDADVEPERPEGAGHALHGPVEVRGARAGETLAVRVDEVVPRDWGRTWADGETFTWSLEGDTWSLGERHVRSAPFLGVIGMPPPEPGEHSTTPPRRWGGNIDCKELVAGTTLYLPISVDGAHVSAGVLWLMTLYFIDKKRGLGPKDALLVDICALYWHFVDVVWIAIFTLVYLIK